MAVYRSLRTLISRNPNKSKLFRTKTIATLSLLSPNRSQGLLSPIPAFDGPLFLSYPPWKLSQSATPLHFQSHVVPFPPKFPPLNFLGGRNLPFNLGLASVISAPDLLNRTIVKEFDGGEVGAGGQAGCAKTFLNLPNLISISRLVSGPFLGWMIMQEMYLPAFVGLAISGATDWLDGHMARKMGINSVIGSYLDPVADKVLIGCVALAMVDRGLLHSGLVGLVVLRDVALIGGAVYKRASSLDGEWKSWFDFFNIEGMRPEKVEPLFLSKVNTVFQLVLVAAALLQPEFGTPETQTYITNMSWLVASTTVASTAAYGAQHLRKESMTIKRNR